MKKMSLNLLCIGSILLMQSSIPASSVLEKTTSQVQTTAWSFNWNSPYELHCQFVVGTNNIIDVVLESDLMMALL